MGVIANGIAHVSFSGGGLFLPARDPYDRQMLIEHVAERVRAKGQVQLLVDDQRWIVRASRGSPLGDCARCGCAADAAGYACTDGDTAYCMKCVLGNGAAGVQPEHAPEMTRS